MYKSPFEFFYAFGGYSYDSSKETADEGRRRCAKSLADAEARARDQGCSFQWSIDPIRDSSDFSDDIPSWPLWECVMHGSDGCIIVALGGVDFGRDGEPWASEYRRVVEAELASEYLTEEQQS